MRVVVGLAIGAVVFFSSGDVLRAAGTDTATESHEQHHADDAAKSVDKGGMDGMDMDGKMHECMEKHKDGKACNHENMEECQEHMKNGDCPMMKRAKSKVKKAPKK